MNTNELIQNVMQWGDDKGILQKATPRTQFNKLLEEIDELAEGIHFNNQEEIIDAIGDCTVVLILLAKLTGTDFETCLQSAYNVISKRTGRMENGVFVKDA